jgi:uncharacterized protein YndB with AHSA1/START domain
MTSAAPQTRSVVVEREIPHPPEKIWRALTLPHLIEEWLMKTDFRPVVGDAFEFSGDWGSVDCKVLEIDPPKRLAYTWVAMGLNSTVTWTLTPTGKGTRLRMEQAGFPMDQDQSYQGAQYSWPAFMEKLEEILARVD